ncbi:hypothetical protein C0585_02565 [Candidatus Woesearchaeota archaeon]|nr:MAG: hypothetical protein C0585_02565 [Candidatus Woesearchaeota archaeon]
MVRPRKTRLVDFKPGVTYFKPRAIPISELEEIVLTFDELETLRLADVEKLNQTDAAAKMEIHQSTFQRTLTRAREKVSDALVNGKAIQIQGGEYNMPGKDGTGPRGQGRRQGYGAVGKCVCPSCGHTEEHIRGQPCNNKKCPKCNTMMTRG